MHFVDSEYAKIASINQGNSLDCHGRKISRQQEALRKSLMRTTVIMILLWSVMILMIYQEILETIDRVGVGVLSKISSSHLDFSILPQRFPLSDRNKITILSEHQFSAWIINSHRYSNANLAKYAGCVTESFSYLKFSEITLMRSRGYKNVLRIQGNSI